MSRSRPALNASLRDIPDQLASGQFSWHVPLADMVMGYGKNQTAAKDFLHIPFCSGRMDDALAGSQPAADRPASAEPPLFEGEESCDGLAFCQDGDPSDGPEAAGGNRELRRQERIGQGRLFPLHGVPCGNLSWPQLSRVDEGYSHGPA